MILLIALIIVNVLLGVIFKLFAKYEVNNFAAIVVNYIVCVVIAYFILGYNPLTPSIVDEKWFPFALLLSLLFIFGFNIVALSFQKFGIAFTSIIQKMSLVLPVMYAVTFYNEGMSTFKFIGIILALFSIILINFPEKTNKDLARLVRSKWIILPIITFGLNGIIEIILFYVEKNELVVSGDIPFVTAIFGLSGIFGGIYLLIRSIINRKNYIRKKEIVAGIILGVPNFYTIYFLVLILSKGWDGSVLFPVNSIGILAVSAVVAFLVFHEPMTKLRIYGLILALSAITMIAIN